MIDFYVMMIREKILTIENVPLNRMQEVQAKLGA